MSAAKPPRPPAPSISACPVFHADPPSVPTPHPLPFSSSPVPRHHKECSPRYAPLPPPPLPNVTFPLSYMPSSRRGRRSSVGRTPNIITTHDQWRSSPGRAMVDGGDGWRQGEGSGGGGSGWQRGGRVKAGAGGGRGGSEWRRGPVASRFPRCPASPRGGRRGWGRLLPRGERGAGAGGLKRSQTGGQLDCQSLHVRKM